MDYHFGIAFTLVRRLSVSWLHLSHLHPMRLAPTLYLRRLVRSSRCAFVGDLLRKVSVNPISALLYVTVLRLSVPIGLCWWTIKLTDIIYRFPSSLCPCAPFNISLCIQVRWSLGPTAIPPTLSLLPLHPHFEFGLGLKMYDMGDVQRYMYSSRIDRCLNERLPI